MSDENSTLFKPGDDPRRNLNGRPRKSVLYAGEIRGYEDHLSKHSLAAAQKLVDLALGEATEEVVTPKGEIVERRLPPDRQAAEYILNRLGGKPVSRKEMEISVQRDGTFSILTGEAAAEHRALRRKLRKLQAQVAQQPHAIEAGYQETTAPALPAPASERVSLLSTAQQGERARGPARVVQHE